MDAMSTQTKGRSQPRADFDWVESGAVRMKAFAASEQALLRRV
jgi:hypothetical protein